MGEILPRLKKLLKKYPNFMEKRNSNLFKHVNVVNNQFLDLYSTIKILNMARDIERPIRIQKIQDIEHNYIIKVEIKVDNLKKFSFYKTNGKSDELLFENSFDKYTNTYSYTHEDNSLTIIPEDKFFVIIETYDEYLFIKGFPENDEYLGNIYDHDKSLDVLGGNLNVPRKRYVSVSEGQLYKTEPPFNRQLTEDDYHYQERILKYVNDFEKSFLPVLDIWKFYSLTTIAQNRHHLLTRQNIDVMRDDDNDDNVKYMRTKTDYHPSVYDIFGDYDDLPSNIKLPQGDEVVDLIQKSLPLSRKAFFSLSAKRIIPYNSFNIADDFKTNIHFKTEKEKIIETYNSDVETGYSFNNNISINEHFNINHESIENNSLINDYLVAFEHYVTEILTPDSFSVTNNVYIEDSEKKKVRLSLEKNILPNTLANQNSLLTTTDWACRGANLTYEDSYALSNISVVTESNKRCFKLNRFKTNLANNYFLFYYNNMRYYGKNGCVTTYLNQPTELTLSFDLKIPIDKRFVVNITRVNNANVGKGVASQTIIGTGDFQKVIINIPPDSSYPYLYFNFSNIDGDYVSAFITDLCLKKGNNGGYIESKIIDTGWKDPTKVKIGTTPQNNPSTFKFGYDITMNASAVTSNNSTSFLYAGGFNLNIPSSAVIHETFGAIFPIGQVSYSDGSSTGACKYNEATGLLNIKTWETKTYSSFDAINNTTWNPNCFAFGNQTLLQSNPNNWCIRANLTNKSSSTGFLGYDGIGARAWYEVNNSNYVTIKGDSITPLISLDRGNDKITMIDVVDTVYMNSTEIIYSILDESNNILINEVSFPFVVDNLNVNKIKISASLFSYDRNYTPSIENYMSYSSRIYNI